MTDAGCGDLSYTVLLVEKRNNRTVLDGTVPSKDCSRYLKSQSPNSGVTDLPPLHVVLFKVKHLSSNQAQFRRLVENANSLTR